MEKNTDRVHIDDRGGDVIVLGAVSVETKGGGGATNEPYGRLIVPGIVEE
ncbi:benenodin family lasso peptide [Luteimonas granuli]|nr:benenodin family lasso peptide [Luteimonas granuli]